MLNTGVYACCLSVCLSVCVFWCLLKCVCVCVCVCECDLFLTQNGRKKWKRTAHDKDYNTVYDDRSDSSFLLAGYQPSEIERVVY